MYFEVRRFPTYGRHSGKNLDELLTGVRVDVDERKRDPRDFALWKAAKPGEPSWPSPWGPGRPGWHIECSAMAMHYLGETFDLHGGGEDLVFPHHECEIAQSEAATGKPFARYWIYNGFVNLSAQKMSKSLGNVLTIEALLARHDPETLRLYLLQTHYRNPVEFAEEGVVGMRRPLERFRDLTDDTARLAPTKPEPNSDRTFLATVAAHRDRFEAAMDDDFNTPQAIAALNLLATVLGEERERVRAGTRSGRDFVTGVDVLSGARAGARLVHGRGAGPAGPELRAGAPDAHRRPGQGAGSGPAAAGLGAGRRPSGRAGRARRGPGGHAGRHEVEAEGSPERALILAGRHPVLEALRSRTRPIEEVLVETETRDRHADIVALARQRGVRLGRAPRV